MRELCLVALKISYKRVGGTGLKSKARRKLHVPLPVRDMVDLYFEKRIGHSSAALAFYLMLSIFPFLICITAMLSRFEVVNGILWFLDGIMPKETLSYIKDYLDYISTVNSAMLITAGSLFMLTSSASAFRVLTAAMENVQGRARFTGFFATLFSFIFSIVFLVAIYISCLVIIGGEWLLSLLNRYIDIGIFPALWNWLRFVMLFFVLYFIILAIYKVTAPRDSRDITRRWGALMAALLLVGISILFSWFVGQSVKYTLVYGSLAAIFILMMWLNLCGNILIMGNAVNVVLHKYKKPRGIVPQSTGQS